MFDTAMSSARWKNQHIASRHLNMSSGRPSQDQSCCSGRDPQDLMRIGMKMMVPENAVAPDATPAIGRERGVEQWLKAIPLATPLYNRTGLSLFGIRKSSPSIKTSAFTCLDFASIPIRPKRAAATRSVQL